VAPLPGARACIIPSEWRRGRVIRAGDIAAQKIGSLCLHPLEHHRGLDGALLATKPVLFISAGSYFEDQAAARHLLGEQWG
jgi:hypothetical protein